MACGGGCDDAIEGLPSLDGRSNWRGIMVAERTVERTRLGSGCHVTAKVTCH